MDIEELNKVARITVYFWIIKILATTLGETLGDFFSMTLNFGYFFSLLITLSFFIVVVFVQIKTSKYYPLLYWLVIVGTTTLGTEISDFMDRTLGFGYAIGSVILFFLLLLVLYFWQKKEKKIVIYPISKKNVEIFYWTAILVSNSLGTAFGDFLSDNVGLSYIHGAMITASIIAIVLFMHYFTKINHIFLFWLAFIFTRPFGATFGDFLTKPVDKGGLHFSTLLASIISAVLIAVVLLYSSRKEKLNKVIVNYGEK